LIREADECRIYQPTIDSAKRFRLAVTQPNRCIAKSEIEEEKTKIVKDINVLEELASSIHFIGKPYGIHASVSQAERKVLKFFSNGKLILTISIINGVSHNVLAVSLEKTGRNFYVDCDKKFSEFVDQLMEVKNPW